MDRLGPNKVIKNKEYLKALVGYAECVDIEFNKIKLNRYFDQIINAPEIVKNALVRLRN